MRTRNKDWQELANFVIDKKIKEVEKWDSNKTSTPTFVFENGDVVEFYVIDGKFGWVLTNRKEIETEIKAAKLSK